jgi:hypothetical protein
MARMARMLGAFSLTLLALTGSASAATTYCISDPSCAGTVQPDLSSALAAAAGSSGRDTIQLGAGSFSGPATDAAGNQVDIVGKGDATVLSGGATVLTMQEPTSTVASLRIDMPGPPTTTGLDLAASATNVAVTGAAGGVYGVHMTGTSSFTGGRVTLPTATGPSTTNAFRIEDPAGTKTITGPSIQATAGIVVDSPIALLSFTNVRNVRMHAQQGIDVRRGQAFVDDVAMTVLPSVGVSDLPLSLTAGSASNASVTARHLTAYGPGVGDVNSRGVLCAFAACSIDVRNSVVRNFATDVDRGAGTLTMSWSDFATSTGTVGGASNTAADPHFVDAAGGDLHPAFPSALIDGGDPAGSGGGPTTDLDGNPRAVNGRVDIGAFEYQRRAPTAVFDYTWAPDGTMTFDGRRSSDPDPGDALTYAWRFSDGATASGAVVAHKFDLATPGSWITVMLTVTDPTGLTGGVGMGVGPGTGVGPAARVTIASFFAQPGRFRAKQGTTFRYTLSAAAKTVRIAIAALADGRRSRGRCVKPAHRLRKAKACTRAVTKGTIAGPTKAGANAVRFSGRLHGRLLSPGRYKATIVATDATGRRSSPRVAPFQVLSPRRRRASATRAATGSP